MTRVLLLLVAGLIILLGAVMVVNTVLMTCEQPEVAPANLIAVDKAAAAGRLAEAVRFETISHQDRGKFMPEAFLRLHRFLQNSYPNVHRALTREVVNGYSLLYTWRGSSAGSKPILLMAHLDVVPIEPGTEATWTYPPFSGRIADGYVWGRGSMDDKASVLGILEAVEFLLAQGFQPTRTVYLAFGHDEELGGGQGAARIAALLKSRGITLDYVLDEGLVIAHGVIPGVTSPVAMIGVAEKGNLILELTATGPGGHASMPPKYSASRILSMALHKLKANPMPMVITGPVRELFQCVAAEMPFTRRMVFANLWLFEPLVKRQLGRLRTTSALVRTTTAVTILRAGAKANQIPTKATAIANFRILPGESTASVKEYVLTVVNDAVTEARMDAKSEAAKKQLRVDVKELRAKEPSPVSADAVSFQTLSTSIRQIFPDTLVAPGLSIVRTDSEYYLALTQAAYRFLPLRLTSEDIRRIHGTNERVAIHNYADAIAFYVHLLRNSAS